MVQKPWPPIRYSAPIRAVLDIFLSIGLVFICGGLGFWIIGPLKRVAELERAAIQFGLGVGAVGTAVLGLGLLGLIKPWVAWACFFLGTILLRKAALKWVRNFQILGDLYKQTGNLGRFSAWVSTFLIGTSFLYALAPPLKWDSLVYHLVLPKQYVAAGGIEFISDNLFIGYPQLAEMVYSWALALRGGSTAATFGWFVGVIGLLGVGGFAGRLLRPRATFIAPAILLSGVSVSWGLSWAYVDLWVLLFGLCMIVSLEYFVRSRNRKWIVLGGIFTGLSLSTKYTAGILLLLGCLYLIFEQIRSVRSWKQSDNDNSFLAPSPSQGKFVGTTFRSIVVFGFITFAVFVPWLAKNLILTQNPIYPFFFPGRNMDELRLSFYTGEGTDQTIVNDLLIPWNATILGVEGKFGFNTSIGPLMLALIPGIAFGWTQFSQERKETLERLVVFAMGAWIIWALAAHVSGPMSRSRHYFGVFPVFTVLAAFGFESLAMIKLPQIRVGRVVGALVMLALVLTFISEVFTFVAVNPSRVLLGYISTDEYVAKELGWFSPVMERINELPDGSRVQFFWEARSYYCEIECSPDVIIDRWWHLRRLTGSSSEIAELLVDQGVTHVLIYDSGAEFEQKHASQFEPVDWERLEEFRNEQLSLIDNFNGTYSLYLLGN